jgi:UDP-2,3-diacylglucosamine pyrophosphatase LpxH
MPLKRTPNLRPTLKRLARNFKDDDAIQFAIPNAADCHFSVYGHRILLTHGDSLGGRGCDIGSIIRGVDRVIRSKEAIGRSVDLVIMGHFHRHMA